MAPSSSQSATAEGAPMNNHVQPALAVDGCSNPRLSGATGGADSRQLQRPADKHCTPEALVAAYGGDTHRLLIDLANLLGASVAYVDRLMVEAHVERPLSDAEWSATVSQFTAMAFDEHVGDAGTLRSDWIEDVLRRADVAGRGQPVTGQPGAQRRRTRP
jgi:hypothetical protein